MFSFIPIYNTAYTDKVEKTTFLLKIDIPNLYYHSFLCRRVGMGVSESYL